MSSFLQFDAIRAMEGTKGKGEFNIVIVGLSARWDCISEHSKRSIATSARYDSYPRTELGRDTWYANQAMFFCKTLPWVKMTQSYFLPKTISPLEQGKCHNIQLKMFWDPRRPPPLGSPRTPQKCNFLDNFPLCPLAQLPFHPPSCYEICSGTARTRGSRK